MLFKCNRLHDELFYFGDRGDNSFATGAVPRLFGWLPRRKRSSPRRRSVFDLSLMFDESCRLWLPQPLKPKPEVFAAQPSGDAASVHIIRESFHPHQSRNHSGGTGVYRRGDEDVIRQPTMTTHCQCSFVLPSSNCDVIALQEISLSACIIKQLILF